MNAQEVKREYHYCDSCQWIWYTSITYPPFEFDSTYLCHLTISFQAYAQSVEHTTDVKMCPICEERKGYNENTR